MKRLLSILIILALTTFSSGCISSEGGGDSAGGGTPFSGQSGVTLDFNLHDMFSMNENIKDTLFAKIIDFLMMAKRCRATPLYEFVTSLSIEVTGTDMQTITYSETIADPSTTFSVTLNVPNGSNRRFFIKLIDRYDRVLYSGELFIDVGTTGGASQDITIAINIDENITPEDYIQIGKWHLEKLDANEEDKVDELELAFVAFDTAVSINTSHPEATFFRGFTKFLLLVQKDNASVNAAAPNADIASMLNLYLGSGVDDIYTSSVAPDIYNENYLNDVDDFRNSDKWVEPSNVSTDSGVDVLKNVMIPELDKIIGDFAKVEAHSGFSTTLTTDMHFGLISEIKVDRGDVYILEAIAYALKAYLNHILAYRLETDSDYWDDEISKQEDDPDNYLGIEDILNNEPGAEGERVFNFESDADARLKTAKTAYSKGLDKFKAGLEDIDGRTNAEKEAEDHIFNVADIDDNGVSDDVNKIDISKVLDNVDEIKAALSGEAIFTGFLSYDDSSTTIDSETEVDLSALFSSPSRDSRPEFYYHRISDTDLPILDNNNPESSSSFVEALTDVLISYRDGDQESWTDINSLEDALREELLPDTYRFDVPEASAAVKSMSGNLIDWSGSTPEIKPVIFDQEDQDAPPCRDITEVYMAKGYNSIVPYLYIAMKLRGVPYPGPFEEGEYINYKLYFNAESDDNDFYSTPVLIELQARPSEGSWKWYLYSYGAQIGQIPADFLYGDDYVLGDIIQFRIPVSFLVGAINEYEPSYHFPEEGWNGEEVYVSFSVDSYISGARTWNSTHSGKLANIGPMILEGPED